MSESMFTDDEWKQIATELGLTPRQLDIVRLVIEGQGDKEIGLALDISQKTVEGHLRRVYARLGLQGARELMARVLTSYFTRHRRKESIPMESPSNGRTLWIGNKDSGVEVRYQGDDLDEAILWFKGKAVMHLERLSDVGYWMGLYPAGLKQTLSIDIASKNLRSHIGAQVRE